MEANITLYAVVRESDNKYFGGFDATVGAPIIVDDVLKAKLFTNKFDISLRPDEKMVEINVSLTRDAISVSAPFRPKRRSDRRV